MVKSILAVLIFGCTALAFASTEAAAFGGGYRPNDPVRTSCWRGPRWSYSAAYYQTYRTHRRHARVHRGYRRSCRRCLTW